MAPQTRRAQVLASTSTSTSRTYHSSPVPQQVHFPARRTTVRTYSRKTASARALRQQTLTQIDYVKQATARLLDDGDGDNGKDGNDTPSREAAKTRPQKRRKTMGDAPSSVSSSFHTQTLTQLLGEKVEDRDVGGELLQIKDSDEEEGEEDDEDDEVVELPKLPPPSRASSKRKQEVQPKVRKSMPPPPPLPQTPKNQRIKVSLDEVPSSQPTPYTPMLERYTPGSGRSPLKERSTNVDAPPPTLATISKTPRNLVIQDSFSDGSNLLSSSAAAAPPSSTKKETPVTNRPPRQPLAELPLGSFELGEDVGTTPNVQTPTRSRLAGATSAAGSKRVFMEIPDSDDELDSLGPSPHPKAAAAAAASQRSQRAVSISDSAKENYTPVHNNRRVVEGPEQEPESADMDMSSSEDLDPGTPTPVVRKVQIQLPSQARSSSHLEEGEEEEEVFEETPRKTQQQQQQQQQRQRQQQSQRHKNNNNHNNKSSPLVQRHHTQARSQYYSQGLESQRVPLDVIRSLGPQTDRSDIVISIHPEPAEQIVLGTKDHEFRSYKFPGQVARCWIYVTRPVCEVRYMAVLGPARQPGEIRSEMGVGNTEFNGGTLGGGAYKYAHELLQVYELNNPVPLADMKEHGLGEGPPQRYKYIPPAIVGQLLANLRCALFADGEEEVDEGGEESEGGEEEEKGEEEGDVTISQELAEQIRSDMIHHSSTQLQQQPPSSSQGPGPRKRAHDNGEEEGEEVIPASPLGMRAPATASTPLTARKTAMRRTPAKGSGSAAAAGRKGIMRSARPTEPTAAAGTSQSAATPAPRSTPRRQSSRIQSQRQQQQQKTPTSRYGYYPGSGNNGGIRPSQATTASQTSTPAVSPAKSSVPRPPMTMPGSSVPSLPDFLAEDGSPVELLRRTGSRAGAGESGSSSQVMMMMQDSLLVGDDEDVRRPPVIWDSEEEED